MSTHEPQEDTSEGTPVRLPAENLVIKLTSVIAGIGGLIFLISWLINLRFHVNGMARDIVLIKTSVQALNRVGELDTKLEELRRYGSEVSRKSAADVDKLRQDFEMHKAMTMGEKKNP